MNNEYNDGHRCWSECDCDVIETNQACPACVRTECVCDHEEHAYAKEVA